ncbi:MAG TPA: homoserine dehydrogenase [Anaerolineales bacterium]|jgi:homoserine dehydrogenase|nr:homoserine dehydrogenase [Anaerolineales bacterium]
MNYRLAFIGFGNVAKWVVRLLERKRDVLKEKYDITYFITGISTGRHGFAVNPDGLDMQKVLELIENGKSISSLSTIQVQDSLAVIQGSQADVMFENTPVNHETGQPAIDHVRAALNEGMHAITANKGTVVHAYRELTELAKSKNKKFYFESTVLGGAPVFSVFREAMPAADLQSFRGIINSTTNIILTHMERGETFDEAVKFCQNIGVAETDPSNDVDGWDAAIKVAALVTVLMDHPLTPQEVDRTGIRSITSEMIQKAKAEGKRWKLVASAERVRNSVKARVAPELVPASSPLYTMQDSTAGLTFRTDVLGDYSIIETEREGMSGGPEETAYGLLADFINAVKK